MIQNKWHNLVLLIEHWFLEEIEFKDTVCIWFDEISKYRKFNMFGVFIPIIIACSCNLTAVLMLVLVR